MASLIAVGMIGVFAVYSATRQSLVTHGFNGRYYLERQMVWVLIGIAVMFVVSRIDYRRFEIATTALYVGALLALIGVYIIGSASNGATRWYSFGPLQLQPSEFALVAVVLAMATYCGRRPDGLSMFDVRRMLLMAGIPMMLIVLQPDLGTGIILAMVVGVMLIMAGVPPRFMVLLVIVGAIAVTAAAYVGVFHAYQLERLVSFFNQNQTTSQCATQNCTLLNAKAAIGAGGITGAGPFNGLQTNGGFVPENRTDFIFTAIGEQFGLIGTVALVLLLAFVSYRVFRIARDAREPLARLLAVGIFVFFAFSCFQNIGMTIGIMPVTGIPLPLVSLGGSAAFVFYLCGGMVLSVSRRRGN